MEIAIVALLVIVLIFLVVLISRKPSKASEQDLFSINFLKEENQKLQQELTQVRANYINENNRATRAEENLKAQREISQKQQQNLEELQQKFTLEFSNIANKLLDEKSAKFTAQNQSNLDQILNPLKANIKSFEEKVEKVYQTEAAERSQLKGVIFQLMDQSKQIQTDANNLTKALKGDNKKQGTWGEIVLERVLETSGLVKDREYSIQKSLNSAEGARLQPDVIINLPDEKNLIVDAKISLVAYERMVSAEDEEEKLIYLKQHLLSIKNHIDGLSAKNYQHLYAINSPDFVLLFLPIEASFSVTVQADTEIFNYAWNRKVVLVSPTTLLATLRTIASIWKVDRQNKNVFEIAEEAGALYDKFVGFLNDMEKIGKHIEQTQKAHDDAFKKLQYGSGNLIGKVEKIKKLGAKTKSNKHIDTKFLDQEEL
ncbi:DNA recombination protein RmuC [Pedobacter chitinilyticus]|uniref:DNA recombination protein RmuC n=1 Tax=Pedobacter chitinilyticus TaxID=2233776 RepID=A0A443YUU0_9SPHI|nr:DNA recombination protein RmuC [Pedobacter chitinilyticus]RWU07631.1 DNA recombination protein RmuC [Pedobacter chitinilyticus]